tara:strand:+ start:356 stop:475 length:120 start_codon:yes stop_codon:yes gene_type:complete
MKINANIEKKYTSFVCPAKKVSRPITIHLKKKSLLKKYI